MIDERSVKTAVRKDIEGVKAICSEHGLTVRLADLQTSSPPYASFAITSKANHWGQLENAILAISMRNGVERVSSYAVGRGMRISVTFAERMGS